MEAAAMPSSHTGVNATLNTPYPKTAKITGTIKYAGNFFIFLFLTEYSVLSD